VSIAAASIDHITPTNVTAAAGVVSRLKLLKAEPPVEFGGERADRWMFWRRKMFDFNPRKRLRPKRSLAYHLRLMARCRCDGCGRPELGPMIIDDLWRRIAEYDDQLCGRCIRRRLGRPITDRDLRDCLWNSIFSGREWGWQSHRPLLERWEEEQSTATEDAA
jgi:hypothetical protein